MNKKKTEKKGIQKASSSGRREIKNKLNALSGKEWMKFTKSWFIHNPPPRKKSEVLHPGKFPESLVQSFIEFFTKPGEIVFDPFLGTGSTIVAALRCERVGVGIELSSKYEIIARKKIEEEEKIQVEKKKNEKRWYLIKGDARLTPVLLKKVGISRIDYCITSPPYWNQLHRDSMRQAKRKEEGLDTVYTSLKADLGNINDYEEFLKAQGDIFDHVKRILRPGGYLTIVTNNVFAHGRMYPLAFDTLKTLEQRGWIPLDEKIWLQNDKRLLPLGIYNSYVGNRHHQYCLIFRKPLEKRKNSLGQNTTNKK